MSLTVTLLESANVNVTGNVPASITLSTGVPGPAATIAVGTVSTLPAGSPATVNNLGSATAAVFNFGIPQGLQGIQGIQGIQGVQGPQGVPGPAGVNTWGSITGSISSQTDLQSVLNGKYSTSNPAGYITSAALSSYATQSFVTSQGYITSTALAPYLISATAATTYYPLSNPSLYITSSALTPYLLSSTASSTYQTKAPSNGNYYIQQNGSWVVVTVY